MRPTLRALTCARSTKRPVRSAMRCAPCIRTACFQACTLNSPGSGLLSEMHNTAVVHTAPGTVVRVQENYFFKLSSYSAAVQDFVASSGAVQPSRAANEVRQWIAEGCRDFSISRAGVDWGIRVPADPAQTVYVWFDALIGYLSALLPEGAAASKEELQQHGWPADVHIIGKDILRFHAVYWPGMLMAMGLPLPATVFGHGFLTKDGNKMGKSLGNVLDPFALTMEYGADAVRCSPFQPLCQVETAPLSAALRRCVARAEQGIPAFEHAVALRTMSMHSWPVRHPPLDNNLCIGLLFIRREGVAGTTS